MSIIANMVARLTADTTAFDRNMQRSRGSLRSMTASIEQNQRAFARMAAMGVKIAIVAAAFRTAKRALSSFAQAGAEQEQAERGLLAALRLTDEARQDVLATLKEHAAEMQRLTIYGDEELLRQMAYAKGMGVVTSELKDATQAAIGLAATYQIELKSAMMLIARARQGQTQTLTRYGIILEETLTAEQKYQKLLSIGIKNFGLAQEQTDTLTGSTVQLGNAWGDFKEAAAMPLLPTMTKAMQFLTKSLDENRGAVDRWAEDFAEGIQVAIDALDKLNAGWLVFKGSQWLDEQVKESAERNEEAVELMRRSIERYRDLFGSLDPQAFEITTQYGGYKAPQGPQFADAFQGIIIEQRAVMEAERQAILAERKRQEAEWERTAKQGAMDRERMVSEEAMGTEGPSTTDIAKETTKVTMDIAAAYRAMCADMDRMTPESYEVRMGLLDKEREAYLAAMEAEKATREQKIEDEIADETAKNEAIADSCEQLARDKALLDKWYAEQKAKRDIEQQKARDDFFTGFAAGIKELQREMKTLGEIGADVAKDLAEGFADAFSQAIVYGKDLEDQIKQLGQQIMAMVMKQMMMKIVTSVIGAGVAHSGGTVGRTSFPQRPVSPAVFATAPRLHIGTDEYPAILQRGERVTSRAMVAAENRRSGEIVGLLQQIAARPHSTKVVIVDDERQLREQLMGPMGEEIVVHHQQRTL